MLIMRIGHRGTVVMGLGLLVRVVVVAVVAVEGEIDLFTGLSEYLCGILLVEVEVTLLRTVVKEDGEIGRRVWIEIVLICVEKLETMFMQLRVSVNILLAMLCLQSPYKDCKRYYHLWPVTCTIKGQFFLFNLVDSWNMGFACVKSQGYGAFMC